MQPATEPQVRLERQPHRDAAERLRRIYRLLQATGPAAAPAPDTAAPEADSVVVVQEDQA